MEDTLGVIHLKMGDLGPHFYHIDSSSVSRQSTHIFPKNSSAKPCLDTCAGRTIRSTGTSISSRKASSLPPITAQLDLDLLIPAQSPKAFLFTNGILSGAEC